MATREQIQERIQIFEANGWFDKDVNDDLPTIILMPDQIDYAQNKLSTRLKSRFANIVAHWYYERLIRKKQLIIKEIVGIENVADVVATGSGAVLTCNHFSVCDNYAIYRPLRQHKHKRLYKVIKEANYTNFKGLFGFFFRHCNTLPLASHVDTMKKFFRDCDQLLKRGEFVLIYPEQSMWNDYRKPRPLKSGAFRLATRSKVPVIPCFITMNDSAVKDGEGYPIQEYTLHYLPAIYPDNSLNDRQNMDMLAQRNYQLWKQTYEQFYGEPLRYATKSEAE